jgi:hypothetical protein
MLYTVRRLGTDTHLILSLLLLKQSDYYCVSHLTQYLLEDSARVSNKMAFAGEQPVQDQGAQSARIKSLLPSNYQARLRGRLFTLFLFLFSLAPGLQCIYTLGCSDRNTKLPLFPAGALAVLASAARFSRRLVLSAFPISSPRLPVKCASHVRRHAQRAWPLYVLLEHIHASLSAHCQSACATLAHHADRTCDHSLDPAPAPAHALPLRLGFSLTCPLHSASFCSRFAWLGTFSLA